jgi:hypothetical protein
MGGRMTAKEKVQKEHPNALAILDRSSGYHHVYTANGGRQLGVAKRENWAWADAWRQVKYMNTY